MFLGEYKYKVDEKGRVPIPSKFRSELGKGLVLVPGVEKCIIAYPLHEWEKLAKSLTSRTLTSNKLRKLNRAIFASAFSLNIDGQGRIIMPNTLRRYAEIEEGVVITGANAYMEMWNEEHWEAEKSTSQEQAWQIIESLEERLPA